MYSPICRVLLEPFRFVGQLALVRQIALLDLPHLRFDLFEIFGSEGCLALKVVIETGLSRRTDAELRLREQFAGPPAPSKCAVEWRYTSSASGFFDVRIWS